MLASTGRAPWLVAYRDASPRLLLFADGVLAQDSPRLTGGGLAARDHANLRRAKGKVAETNPTSMLAGSDVDPSHITLLNKECSA